MKRFALSLCLLFLGCYLSRAQAQPQHPDSLTALVAGELVEVKHWRDIPAAVRAALVKEWKEDWIADPGEPFQVTDVIGPEKLPGLRLILAARARSAWLVCFEAGGVAHSFNLAIVPISDGKVAGQVRQVVFLPPAVTDLRSLREAIRAKRYMG